MLLNPRYIVIIGGSYVGSFYTLRSNIVVGLNLANNKIHQESAPPNNSLLLSMAAFECY
jgi:hypothetical protein